MPLQHNKTPLVYLITKGAATNDNFSIESERILDLIKAAVEAKISLVQIREKQLNARLVFDLVCRAALITKNSETALLVNDRADVAFAANADGVHLTANSLSAKIIRQIFPSNFIVGVSTHSLADVLNAKNQSADFATFSPIFSTPNKGEPQGLERLREICREAQKFPIIALGGVDESNFTDALAVGARGVAAIRSFNDVERLSRFARTAREFKNSR
jgi:thiamine-phosphate pyrophosphorylase